MNPWKRLREWWSARRICACGRQMWFSAAGDGYYCSHGRHMRDETTPGSGISNAQAREYRELANAMARDKAAMAHNNRMMEEK